MYLRKDQRDVIESTMFVLRSHYDQLTPDEQKIVDDFIKFNNDIVMESRKHTDAAVISMRRYLSTEKGKEQNRLRSRENKLKAKLEKEKAKEKE